MAFIPKFTFASLLVFCIAFNQSSKENLVHVSVDSDTLHILQEHFKFASAHLGQEGSIAVLQIPERDIDFLSKLIHSKFGRCGGFMIEESAKTAFDDWKKAASLIKKQEADFYQIDQQQEVRESIEQVDANTMASTIESLSNFRNRYYKSNFGIESQQWILEKWKNLSKGIDTIEVDLFEHSAFPQPSVILTWHGSELGDETLILGGHGDSIAGWFPGNNVLAPGADDNASGIATITEVIRILVAQNFEPKRTIKFISYAAEEVGLRGSKEIAEKAKDDQQNVKGVMQLDMTNFKGSSNDIILISDFTNAAQNEFLGGLIDEYQSELSWILDPCGYACSDHASWTRNGFPASFPFESTMDTHNQHIHTSSDTIDKSEHKAIHASKFAKLALSFLIELSS
ncbi:MAG: M20/M25/M40 family metallo-hydrolase [Oligoflexales bacterium]